MRLLYGFIALFLWAVLMKGYMICCNADIPNNLQILTSCIVIAGAMAGGD